MRGPVPVTPLPPTPITSVKYYHNERLCSQRSDEAITVSSLLVSQHAGTNNICLFRLNDFLRSRDPKPNEKLNHVQHCLKYKFCEQSKQNNDPHGGPGRKKNGNCIVNQLMGHFRDWDVTEILGQPLRLTSLDSSEKCTGEEPFSEDCLFLSVWARSLGLP